ncbi:CsbD family protein [Solimonas sp. K1W22B-7]|uniref:CsbD family protein n=1 Tax=Solimonas sp. K1W22B-7 TaxID=2303331 RepID=UPI000E333920|nr:CsbD family protein [Solimonas sp. K1W22B-7]AXQ27617.1 CsbD family protein [Solimonas sp. K1W22B-7]
MNTNDAKHSGSVDKAKGHAKEVIGATKEKVGRLIGDDELEAKGHLQNAEGKKDRLKGEIKEGIEDAKAKVKAGVEAVKDKIQGHH